MLGRLQRLRRHIRYHSAPRPGNRWSRALDVAFIATFLLALPAALLSDLSSIDARPTINLPGIIAQRTDGSIDAWVTESPPAGSSAASGTGAATSGGSAALTGGGNARSGGRADSILGNFNLSVTDELHGWPLVTSIMRRPAMLNIDILSEVRPRTRVQRQHDDALQQAIEKALTDGDRLDALAAWNMREPQTRRQWWAWFPAVGAWWILMFAIAAVVIQCLRFGSLWVTAKRVQREAGRRAEGKCIACGYDMTGLDFNAKCPECGANVW